MEDSNAYWSSIIMTPESFFLNLAYPPFQDWGETFSPIHLIENQFEIFIANTLNLYSIPLFFMKFLIPGQQPEDTIANIAKRATSSKKRG